MPKYLISTWLTWHRKRSIQEKILNRYFLFTMSLYSYCTFSQGLVFLSLCMNFIIIITANISYSDQTKAVRNAKTHRYTSSLESISLSVVPDSFGDSMTAGPWAPSSLGDRYPLMRQIVKNLPAMRLGFDAWVGKVPGKGMWKPLHDILENP